MRVRLFALLSALALFVLAAAPASASASKFDPPKSFYLALGDSLAFGYQQAKFNANLPFGEPPTAFNTGYVDDFSTMLQAINPAIKTVNLGCPGETTATFMNGGCPYTASLPLCCQLHDSYAGDQLDAALGFLGKHPGQVSPITIDLGANDLNVCKFDLSCIQTQIAVVATNMHTILTALRGAAPSAEIIVMEYYNPFAFINTSTNVAAEQLNAVIANDAVEVGGRVADAFTPFNVALPQPQTLCTLTLFCTQGDIHASDQGYMVIANQFFSASGYARLSD
jgi:lysophospholipase L1-like esterase